MLYFATASGPRVREAMAAGTLGMIANPASGNVVMPGVRWCADNAVFGGKYPGDIEYLSWLSERRQYVSTCVFATAPDVVGDAWATLERSAPMFELIRELGYPVALCAQDGLEDLVVPWDEFDVLFIGGSTEWKVGPAAAGLVAEAKQRGKWVHMGRVNSLRRLRIADAMGCDSVDGTFLAFGPNVNLPLVEGWLTTVNDQGVLW